LVSYQFGADLTQLSKDIAGRIASRRPRPESIRVLTCGTPGAHQSKLRQVRQILEQELRRRRLNLVEEAAALTVTLSFGEGLKGRILIAEVNALEQRDLDAKDIIIVPIPAEAPSRGISFQKSLLWRQNQPILDFVVQGDRLWILSPRRISALENIEHGWKERTGWDLENVEHVQRDPRGRLFVDSTGLRAFLPGVQCEGNAEPGSRVTCSTTDRGFPATPSDPTLATIRLAPGRNYFDQLRTSRGLVRDLPSFYTVAVVSGPGGPVWALSDLGRRTRIYNSTFSEIGQASGWTSELASAELGECGSWILAGTENGDGQEGLQAFQWIGDRPVAGGERLELDGVVTALWPDGGNRVRLVERNLESGGYAAWSVTLICVN